MIDSQKGPLMGCLACGELTTSITVCPRCGSRDSLVGPLEPKNAAKNLATIRAENWE